jgi:ureidoglycolate lyase
MEIMAQSLTADAFALFGEVIDPLTYPGRKFFNEGLANARAGAEVNLSRARLDPLTDLPLLARELERHEFSSQTFLPINVSRYLIIVAPMAADGGPDVAGVCAFVANGDQGITYRLNTWHHGMRVLDEPGDFAVLMWCDGTSDDEEFRSLDQPFSVFLPD